MKICSICEIEKPLTEFRKDPRKPDGLRNDCKKCCSDRDKAYRKNNKEKIKKYNQTPSVKEKRKKCTQKWHKDNPDYGKKYRKYTPYKDRNPDKINARRRGLAAEKNGYSSYNEYKTNMNKNMEIKKYKNKLTKINKRIFKLKLKILNKKVKIAKDGIPGNSYGNRYRNNNPHYRTIDNYRARIRKAHRIQSTSKTCGTYELLGMSGEELYIYLSNMYDGNDYVIDHIIPISRFDLSIKEHALIACYYMNLQPLSGTENNIKHDTLPRNWCDILIDMCNDRGIDPEPIIRHIQQQ